MHNGMLATLEDVVEFYDQCGGENDFSANKTELIKPLSLTDRERAQLVAFLQALSGHINLVEEPHLPDYVPWS
jgi:cytochrome c peroxidase